MMAALALDLNLLNRGVFFGVIASLSCTIFGCTTPSQKEGLADQAVRLQIRIQELPTNAAEQSDPLVRIWMTPVVGGIFGPPVGRRLVDKRVYASGKFPISLAKIESGLAAAAKTTRGQGDLGTFNPSETRIARLGTMAENLRKPTARYFTGLRDPASGHTLILIYVDRPCSIHAINSELVLMRPGLHWIENLDPPDPPAVETVASASMKHYKLREAPQDVVYNLTEF